MFARTALLSVLCLSAAWGPFVGSVSSASDAFDKDWRGYVTTTLDTLLARGTDRYGSVHSPMIMAVIDPVTLDSPPHPDVLDGLVRLEGRIHRRGERGSNLWNDQSTLRTMYQLSKLTGDNKYANAADAYIRFAFEHCHKPNGLLTWGSHIHWDCYRDRAGGDQDGLGPHEILINHALWDQMYRVNPEGVRREIEAIWQYHVHNKSTGQFNRHDSGHPGFDFPFAGGSYIMAFAFLHSVTPGDTVFLNRAKVVANWHWKARNPETNLAPYLASKKNSDESIGFYGRNFTSAITGPLASALLRSYEWTGDAEFRDMAVAYIKAYDTYGWNEEAQNYFGMLQLDGIPTEIEDVPIDMKDQVYEPGKPEPNVNFSVPPVGLVDVWPTTIYPMDFPLITAEATAYAYETTCENGQPGDPDLLSEGERWAKVIEATLPPQSGRTFKDTLSDAMPRVRETGGTYADNYGRVISFFVHLFRATKNEKYLHLAEQVAQDAVSKLYVESPAGEQTDRKRYGLFKGHPAKPNYEAVDGVGILLFALLELSDPSLEMRGAF